MTHVGASGWSGDVTKERARGTSPGYIGRGRGADFEAGLGCTMRMRHCEGGPHVCAKSDS